MQTKLISIGAVVALIAGLTAFNHSFNQPRITPAQEEAATEIEERIEEASKAEEETALAEAGDGATTDAAQRTELAEALTKVTGFDGAPADIMEQIQEVAEWPEEVPEPCMLKLELSNGDVLMELHKDWAPIGAAHFYKLAKMGFYNEARFYRVVPNFMVQVGIGADSEINAQWKDQNIQDEPVKQSNKPGMVSFAMLGGVKHSRSTSFFISTRDNAYLDGMGFAPFGLVFHGMDVINSINPEYGENPDQMEGHRRGNAYFNEKFPKLDYIKRIVLVERKPQEN